MSRSLFLALCTVAFLVSPLTAQDDDSSVRVHVADVVFQEEQPEGTLPPVEVRPPETLPPVEVTPPVSDAFDLPFSYPSLSDLEFEGFGSALRSTRSIFDDPRHVTIVDPLRLQERMPVDMINALETEVGVLMQRTGSGHVSPFIRGLTGPQTLLLIDGIRLTNSTFRSGPNQNFASIDPAMIDRIEVVRGPQSVLWGSDAIGGVINVVTRSASDGFSYDYMGGEFVQRFRSADYASYSRASVEGSINSMSFFGGGSYLNVQNLDRGGGLGRQPLTAYDKYAGDIKIDYLLNAQQMLTVSLQHVELQDVPRTDKFPKETRFFDPQQRDLAYLRWQGTSDSILFDTFMLTASYQEQKTSTIRRKPPTSTTEDQKEFEVGTTGINIVLAKDLDRLGIVTWGADWYHDEVDAFFNRIDTVTGTVTPKTPEFPNDSFYERIATFLQWDVLVTDRLSAITGVRYTSIDTGATIALFDPNSPGFPNDPPVPTPIDPEFQDWTYSVGLVYELCPHVHVVGSIAEGFRAPNLDDLTTVSDNVNLGVDLPPSGSLSPEISTNYEIGAKLNFDRVRGQIFYFWTDIDGLLQPVLVGTDPGPPVIDFFQRKNVGQAEMQGLELGGEFLLTPQWSVYGNMFYTYGQNITDNEPMRRIPPTQGIVGIRFRDEDGRNWFDVYAWLVRKQDRLSSLDIKDSRVPDGGTPGYATLNVRAGTYITPNQRLTLWLENITDKAYRVHGSGVDGPGFSGNLGYELFY